MYHYYWDSYEFLSWRRCYKCPIFFHRFDDFNIQNIPSDPILISHLVMVALLMIIFPYSKLLHAPGLFLVPQEIKLIMQEIKDILQNGLKN